MSTHPRNVQAIRDWYQANQPDGLPHFDTLLDLDQTGIGIGQAAVALALHAFEAGRAFENLNRGMPLGGGAHYLPPDELAAAERADADAAIVCACFYDCRSCSKSGTWHQHDSDPCQVHPDAPIS